MFPREFIHEFDKNLALLFRSIVSLCYSFWLSKFDASPTVATFSLALLIFILFWLNDLLIYSRFWFSLSSGVNMEFLWFKLLNWTSWKKLVCRHSNLSKAVGSVAWEKNSFEWFPDFFCSKLHVLIVFKIYLPTGSRKINCIAKVGIHF